jgi:hypothetical protein
MLGEGDSVAFQGWLQIATSTGFVGLAWYLIVIALPKMQERFDLHSDRQLLKFEEQVRFIVERHEATVEKITAAQEKQIDRILQSFNATLK